MSRSGIRRPSTVTVPASGATSPTIARMSVVLPAPFGPSRPYISPVLTRSVTPSSACMSPNFFWTSSTSTATASAIRSLLIRSHRAQPVFGQHHHGFLNFDFEPQQLLRESSRQKVKKDRPDERLQRKQWMHPPQPARHHLLHHVGARGTKGRRYEVASSIFRVRAQRAELQEYRSEQADPRATRAVHGPRDRARDLRHHEIGCLVSPRADWPAWPTVGLSPRARRPRGPTRMRSRVCVATWNDTRQDVPSRQVSILNDLGLRLGGRVLG